MLVSNSSTLILLAKVSALETFLENSDEVIIPEEVYKESVENKTHFDAFLIQKHIGGKISVKKTNKNIEMIKKQFRLDEGEAAAFALYDKQKHKAILTDDRELIKLCKLEKIKFLCALGIIVALYKKQKISKKECLEKMEKLQKFGRYSKEIINYFTAEVM